jgi:hypothetical protein
VSTSRRDHLAEEFKNADGGIFFVFTNFFVPLVKGSEPFRLAMQLLGDNMYFLLMYFRVSACAFYALQDTMEQRGQKVLESLLSGKIRPFEVCACVRVSAWVCLVGLHRLGCDCVHACNSAPAVPFMLHVLLCAECRLFHGVMHMSG